MPATLSPAIMMGEIAAAIQVCIEVEFYLFFYYMNTTFNDFQSIFCKKTNYWVLKKRKSLKGMANVRFFDIVKNQKR